jgi:hypothetical protein
MAKKNFGIPDDVLSEIMERDKKCVYCHKVMIYPYIGKNAKDSATIEHLSPDPPFHWSDGMQASNIVMCCGSCNPSRGAKQLADWFNSAYCLAGNINENTVAEPVKNYLQRENMRD